MNVNPGYCVTLTGVPLSGHSNDYKDRMWGREFAWSLCKEPSTWPQLSTGVRKGNLSSFPSAPGGTLVTSGMLYVITKPWGAQEAVS